MKKLISVFCSLTVSSTAIASVTACGAKNNAAAQDQANLEFEIEELKEDVAIEDLKDGIDGSHLSVNNTVGDALDEIQETILTDFPEASEIIMPEDQSQNLLKSGNNHFNIGIKDSHANITNVDALVTGVQTISFTNDEEKEASHDEIRSLQLIKQKFEHGLNASHLYGWNTIYDALEYFQNEAKKINKNAEVIFTKNYLNSTIGQSVYKSFNDSPIVWHSIQSSNSITSNFIQPIRQNGSFESALNNSLNWMGAQVSKNLYNKKPQNVENSISNVDLGTKYATNKSSRNIWDKIKNEYWPKAKQFFSDKVWPNVQKGIEFVKTNFPKFKTWVTDKFHEFTHIKSAFLSGKEQNFELLVSFGNPLSDQSFSKNKTIIKGKLWGMQERSRENAKKIIEKEIFPFHIHAKHQINYNAALEAFRQHAESNFFPIQANVDPARSFQLRTVLKNPQDSTKTLQKGLNLIPVVLKPADSWKNWVWGLIGQEKSDLDVLIHIQVN